MSGAEEVGVVKGRRLGALKGMEESINLKHHRKVIFFMKTFSEIFDKTKHKKVKK